MTKEFANPDEESARKAQEFCSKAEAALRTQWQRVENAQRKRIPLMLNEWKKAEEATWERIRSDGISILRLVWDLERSTEELEHLQAEHIARGKAVGKRVKRFADATDQLEKADKPISDLNNLATQANTADLVLENIDGALDLIQDNFALLRNVPGLLKRVSESKQLVQKLMHTLRFDVHIAYTTSQSDLEKFKKLLGKLKDTKIDADAAGVYYAFEKRWKDRLTPHFEKFTRAVAKYEMESKRVLQRLADILVGGGAQLLGIPVNAELFRNLVHYRRKQWGVYRVLDDHLATWEKGWHLMKRRLGDRMQRILEEAHAKEREIDRKTEEDIGRATRKWEDAVKKREARRDRDIKPLSRKIEALENERDSHQVPGYVDTEIGRIEEQIREIERLFEVDATELRAKLNGQVELLEAERKAALDKLEKHQRDLDKEIDKIR
ncbi:MAG: hypothetical protein QNJ98_19585 [Planctomycetota bacterium]|nr:hypothetical protein [Planctomycetota bacterium]